MAGSAIPEASDDVAHTGKSQRSMFRAGQMHSKLFSPTAAWEMIGGGIGIHWEGVDEDISVASLCSPRTSCACLAIRRNGLTKKRDAAERLYRVSKARLYYGVSSEQFSRQVNSMRCFERHCGDRRSKPGPDSVATRIQRGVHQAEQVRRMLRRMRRAFYARHGLQFSRRSQRPADRSGGVSRFPLSTLRKDQAGSTPKCSIWRRRPKLPSMRVVSGRCFRPC